MPHIVVTVSPRGETTVETEGFAGPGCQAATRALETALGLVLQDRPTTEFFQPSTTDAAQTLASDASR
jgi:hypothetical protein